MVHQIRLDHAEVINKENQINCLSVTCNDTCHMPCQPCHHLYYSLLVSPLQHSRQIALVLRYGELIDGPLGGRPQLPVHVLDVVFEWLLAKVRVHHLAGCLQANSWVQLRGQVPEGDAQVVSVFRVETGVVHQIDTTADDVARGERWPVRLASPRTAKRVAIVAVVAIGLLVPARQTVHLKVLRSQANAHVAVPSLRDDLHLEVVQAAR